MHADSTFVIGDAHKVCQDYALHYPGVTGISYGLVSDGCSSSAMTDVGARLLVLSAEALFHQNLWRVDRASIEGAIIHADRVRAQFMLPETCLDATLLGFHASGSRLLTFGIGDGVVAMKNGSGCISIDDIESDSGYPLYPSYLLNKKRLKEVEKLGGWSVRETFFTEANKPVWPLRGNEEFYDGFGLMVHDGKLLGSSLSVVAVFSDGVKSFVDADRRPVPFQEVVVGLLDFKSFKGEFVKRRMQGFLREAVRKGWKHDDDLSMAAVYLGEE